MLLAQYSIKPQVPSADIFAFSWIAKKKQKKMKSYNGTKTNHSQYQNLGAIDEDYGLDGSGLKWQLLRLLLLTLSGFDEWNRDQRERDREKERCCKRPLTSLSLRFYSLILVSSSFPSLSKQKPQIRENTLMWVRRDWMIAQYIPRRERQFIITMDPDSNAHWSRRLVHV